MKIREEELKVENVNLHMSLIDTENAVIIFVFEKNERIGTLAFALPRTSPDKINLSSSLVGVKNQIVSRALAERAALEFNKMALVSVFTTLTESKALKYSFELLRKFRKEQG